MFATPRSRIASLGSLLALSLLAACSPAPQDAPAAPPAPAPEAVVEAAPAPVPATVYQGARLILGDGNVIENGSFVVQDGLFTAVGASGSVTLPAGATTVDLTGATVMPTLIDGHVHLNTTREALIEDLRKRATYGVSAAFGMGMDGDAVPLQVRDEAAPGIALYRSAGRGLTTPEPGRTEVPHWVTTAEEARAAVREEAARGVDIIKIWVDDRNGQYERLTPELFGAIIDEAHANGLRVTAHIFGVQDAKDLLSAGVDAFAHGVREEDIDDAFVAQIQARPDVVVVPNLPSRGVATDLEWLRGTIPDEQLQPLLDAPTGQQATLDAFGIQARNLKRLADAGVRIAMGTDGNVAWGAHIEMEDMVASGMSALDVLTAATSTSAAYMQLDDRGTLAAGKLADFLVLDANPLDDITNTRRIRSVYLAGNPVAR
jgi:imidazolonepropionase-like amidohydrolase